MISARKLSRLVTAVLHEQIKKATIYVSPKEVIKATYFGKKDRRSRRESVMVTFGAPNWAERQFIQKCKQAKEPFPVRKIQFKLVKKAA